MAQAQSKSPPPTVAKRRRRGRLTVSSRAQSKVGTAQDVAFSMSSERVERLWRNKAAVARILETYAKAAEDAERSGHPLQLNITVPPTPGGTTVEVTKSEADELDAALARAEARGAAMAASLLSAQDMLSADAFGALIDATRETVHQKRRRGEVLGLEGAKRGVRFPSWQLVEGHLLLPGLPKVFDKFDGQPWAVYRFLLQAHPELDGKSALEALKAGRVDQVLAVANNVAGGVFG